MATQNAPIRPFTQPVSAMRKNHLQALCRHFNLDDDGPVTTLRELLKTHLRNNRQRLEDNPIYARLYPRLGRGRQPGRNQPDDHHHDEDHNPQRNSQPPPPAPSDHDEWHGIQHPDDDNDANDVAGTRNNSPIPSPEPDDPPRSPQTIQGRRRSVSFSTYLFSPFCPTLPSPPFPPPFSRKGSLFRDFIELHRPLHIEAS